LISDGLAELLIEPFNLVHHLCLSLSKTQGLVSKNEISAFAFCHSIKNKIAAAFAKSAELKRRKYGTK